MYLITRPPRDFDFIYSERQREAERGHEREGMRGREWVVEAEGMFNKKEKGFKLKRIIVCAEEWACLMSCW